MQKTIIPRQSERAIVLACVGADSRHVQVGAPGSREGAHALFAVLDAEQSGFYRENGRLRMRAATPHSIGGELVRFYRVRDEGSHEFGAIRTVPVGHIARKAAKS